MPHYETKPCAAHGCAERIKRRLLMCPHHWRMVPRDVQDRVINTLDDWQRGGSAKPYVHAVAEAQLAVAIKDNLGADVIAALAADVTKYQAVAK
jgi:hypothetical protein